MILKQTKVVYSPDNNPANESLVDMVLNVEHISVVLPGKSAGTLTIILQNKLRYTIQDSIENLLGGGKKKK